MNRLKTVTRGQSIVHLLPPQRDYAEYLYHPCLNFEVYNQTQYGDDKNFSGTKHVPSARQAAWLAHQHLIGL